MVQRAGRSRTTSMTEYIPFIRPDLPDPNLLSGDLAAIGQANWYTNFGPIEREFRKDIASFLEQPGLFVATMNNATTGLMAALAGLLPRGDGNSHVAIASFTFAAGAQAIIWHGYKPAWFDIDAVSLQPSIASFRALLANEPNISAILLTNTFGIGNSEIGEWEDLADSLGLPLIIDSAAGFGSRYLSGELLGSRGDCEVFSFHATKPFAIGEGGAVTTRSESLADQMRRFTNFGFGASQGAIEIGLNGKLQELNAAIGRRQLTAFGDSLQSRRAVLDHYITAFAELPLIFPSAIRESSVCFASVILNSPGSLDGTLASLRDARIDVRTYYSPQLHHQPWFRRFAPKVSLTESEDTSKRVISLPVLPNMKPEEITSVTNAVVQAL